MMNNYGFDAPESIGWIRLCRPGSIIGPQQKFLIFYYEDMIKRIEEKKKEEDFNYQKITLQYLQDSSKSKTDTNIPTLKRRHIPTCCSHNPKEQRAKHQSAKLFRPIANERDTRASALRKGVCHKYSNSFAPCKFPTLHNMNSTFSDYSDAPLAVQAVSLQPEHAQPRKFQMGKT